MRLVNTLTQFNIRDLLAWIIIKCTNDDMYADDDTSLDRETNDFDIRDRIISATIKLIDLNFFKNTSQSNDGRRPCKYLLNYCLPS